MSGSLARRFLLVLALAPVLLGAGGCGYGPRVTNGNIEVYYRDGASKAEAERLGAYLAGQWGAAGERRSVQLRKAGDKYQFRMVVKKEFQNNPAYLAEGPILAARLSRDVFNGAEVEVHACDDRFNTLKTLSVRDDMHSSLVLDKIEVFYSSAVSRDEADAFARHIRAEVGDDGVERTFTLTRRDDVVEVRLPCNPNVLNDPAAQEALRRDARALSAKVFKKAPVELHLCDGSLNVQKVIKP
jgi:hypothetical protein